MKYVRLTCGVAAVAGLALAAGYPASGSPRPGVQNKAVAAATRAQRGPVIRRPMRLVPLRKSITQLTAAELQSLRNGIAQMKAWNTEPHGSANYKRSLAYWANMHAYIGTGCGPNSALNLPGMSGITVQTPSTPDENATWCTCEHGTDQFLTWHRMYLYYFEKVLQAAAGNPSLRLPYWDYEKDGHLPAAYRSPTYVKNGVTVPNPLYVPNRQAQLNNGSAALTPAVVSTAGAMPNTSYLPFNSALEQTPHGSVHCATGVQSCPSGYMGYVPTAGDDPIFYSHHANIDRLYECWLRINPAQRLPSGAMLNATFSFINGAGNLVTRKVGDMLTTQQLGYGYTAGAGCPVTLRPIRPPILWREQPWRVFPLQGPTRLERGTTRVPVQLPADLRSQLFSSPRAMGPARQATLVLDDVTFDEAPGVMYDVALQGANGRTVPVGVINFFTETAPRHGNMAAMRPPGRKTFDATAALQTLGAGAANARLVLQPTTGLTGASTALAEERVNPRANVRFSAARLELR